MRAEPKGYLLKDMPIDELLQAIRLAIRGYTQLALGFLAKANSKGSSIKS